ncbi:hypothetical protein [Brevibacillus porteri]|uniref:hypothetical protein n=1 Tax=Brevibacillus porteri TaxID=2126350 RepID=UPI003631B000
MLSDLQLGRTLFFLDSETKKPDFCPKNEDLPSFFYEKFFFLEIKHCRKSHFPINNQLLPKKKGDLVAIFVTITFISLFPCFSEYEW